MSDPLDKIKRSVQFVSIESKSKRFLTSIAQRMANLIKTRTRLGKDSFNKKFPGVKATVAVDKGSDLRDPGNRAVIGQIKVPAR